MKIRSGLGIVLLSALAASCTSSRDKSLEGRANGSPGSGTQAPEITQASISRQDELNKKRLDELASLYPSPNMVPKYIGDFEAFIDSKVLERRLEMTKMVQNPDYWTHVVSNFDDKKPIDFYPFRKRDITAREKLEATIAKPDSRQELEEAIITEISGHVRLDGMIHWLATGLHPSFLPIFAYADSASFGKGDASFVFNFSREAFEGLAVFMDYTSGKTTNIGAQTNSLSSYVLAKIYAEQMANGVIAGEKISSRDRMALNDDIRIRISRASALMDTYRYFSQIDSQSHETLFVGIVLKESMRLAEPDSTDTRTITPKGRTLIEKLKMDYNILLPDVASVSPK